jgi:hypothetical protein
VAPADARGLGSAAALRTFRLISSACRDKRAGSPRGAKQRRSIAGDCFRQLSLSSLEVRPDGVFATQGPIQRSEEESSVVLFYCSVGDDASTYLEHTVPLYDKPYVTLTESTQASPLRRGAGSYLPSKRSVFIAAGGKSGYLQRDGIHIGIGAGGESAVLGAARALVPMS